MAVLIEFETDRLSLRQWIETDREPLFARLNSDPQVMEFLPNLLDRVASDAMFDRLQSRIADRGWGFWAVESKIDRQFIGFVGLNIPQYELSFAPCVEVGWRLAVEYWGKGYATEAAKGALEIGFERLDVPEIVSFTTTNHRSRAVMERLGMERAAETFEHPLLAVGHPLREHYLYRLARAKWQSAR
ncbi:GNAT family N-acetyltransferase [Chamaesiphon sp. VAR_69_metabat_338]|uniref:GNAT family N-acetyltransferase n=1 Tax=Chamaesiphon sp. VAR_69_metabat_338 TaxID=2964704 RepID=UPI00286E4821|nr:GNAT family N-acetyltransferase [Chamaesiphon sp. VAR_69_metabat_338]